MSSWTTRQAVVWGVFLGGMLAGHAQEAPVPLEKYLRDSVVSKDVIDTFLDPNQISWAQFDPELGYILGNYLPEDGIDGSATISTVLGNGARSPHNYVGRKCRINTYGNSFTQCHQVSDGETWQEYLAAHLGEPIRNFGMGGYGVYQAYRRMLREEKTDAAAEYIILYIWGNDHLRSLMRCRHAAIYKWWRDDGGRLFHNNFWANIEMDLDSGQLVEKKNRLPTRESLYRMTDPDWTYENLRDDLALQMDLYVRGLTSDLDWAAVNRLARIFGVPALTPDSSKEQVSGLLDRYALAATKYILRKARQFTDSEGKKLLIVLFDPNRVMSSLVESKGRFDQEIVDFLKDNNYRFFDMNVVHVEDFRNNFKISFLEYRRRYFHGHYKPAGNHFFAFAIKDEIVDWLDPKPLPYQDRDEALQHFSEFLNENDAR